MSFRFGAVVYVCILGVAILSLVADIFGVPTGSTVNQGIDTSILSPVLDALPFLICLLAVILVFYALRHYPVRLPGEIDQIISPGKQRHSRASHANIPKGIELPDADLDAETTILIGDIDFEANEYHEQLSQDSISGYTPSPEVDAINRARVYASCGQNFQAIDLLMQTLDEPGAGYDELVVEIINTMEKEMDSKKTSKERRDFLCTQRDDFLQRVSRERLKMTADVWRQIHLKYPVQTDSSLYKLGVFATPEQNLAATAY